MDIAEFFVARLDELEAAANAAAGKRKPPWRSEVLATDLAGRVNNSPEGASPSARDRGVVADTNSRSIADHIARHDPAAVLADTAADRRLLTAYEDVVEFSDSWIGLSLAVKIRAERFASHPDYRQEWAVTREGS